MKRIEGNKSRAPRRSSSPDLPLAAFGRVITAVGYNLLVNRTPFRSGWPYDGTPDASGLRLLLGSVAALKVFGSAEDITAKIDSVKKAMENVGDHTVPALKKEAEHLEGIRADMETIEKFLATTGWKFDGETRKAVRMAKGHRGKDFLGECVWSIYTEKYREEYKKTNSTGKAVIRRKIASDLTPFFDTEELSPGNRAPIYRAIDKRERRSEK